MTDIPAQDDPLGSLYQRVALPAYRLALALLGEPGEAEDVVQEAFVRLAQRVDGLRDPQALDGYVTRAVRNLAYNRLRRQRTAQAGRSTVESRAQGYVEPAEPGACEQAQRTARALTRLTPTQREVVHLRVYEGLPFPEIARRTRAPLGTVHSRYRAALTRLRALLEEDTHA